MGNGMSDSAKGVLNWILAIGIIAFILLLFVIIFGNLQGNVGFSTVTLDPVVNESQNLTTAFTVDSFDNQVNPVLSSVTILNASGGETISATNYTISGAVVTSIGEVNWDDVNASYTLTYDSQGLADSNAVILNYTESATNTSAQLPTVGTILGIVILIIILLAVLIFVIVKLMGLSGSSGSGVSMNTEFGNTNGKF